METPHTIVIVGGVDGNQSKLETQLEPTKLNQDVGIAITSLFHGEVFNINETNNTIHYGIPTGALRRNQNIWEAAQEIYSFKIPVGHYSSAATILRVISDGFRRLRFMEGRLLEGTKPKLEVKLDKENVIRITAEYMEIKVENHPDGPWELLQIKNNFNYLGNFQTVRNVTYSQNIQPGFLYVNIVENSYINGKLSRILSVVPISSKADWSFYEYSQPNYVPIDVKQFSKIFLEIRDMDGRYIQFNPKYKTIITLRTMAINRSSEK